MEIYHQFYNTPKFFPTWKIDYLFLGTFNPSCGQQIDYYYRRPSNGFWRILKYHFDPHNEYNLDTYEGLKPFMEDKGIGCVDVIKKVTFPDNKMDRICGAGYTDAALFTVNGFVREYTFEEIKNLVIERKSCKVFTTWGNRNNPNEFMEKVEDFINFCSENGVCHTPLPSPSGRIYNGINIPLIRDEWVNRIANDLCNTPL